MRTRRFLTGMAAAVAAAVAVVGSALAAPGAGAKPAPPGAPYLAGLGAPMQVGSTVPTNGDVNPYGIVALTQSAGLLVAGETLISNFNDSANVQGTGTTLVEVAPDGTPTLFAQLDPSTVNCPGGIGLTTALSVLPGGWVVVGSVPAGPGGALPALSPAGCLIVLNSSGTVVTTFSDPALNGPWDMTSTVSGSTAQLFVANALSLAPGGTAPKNHGTCTVTRVDLSLSGSMPSVTGVTVIGDDFFCRPNAAAFVQGPTGVALGSDGTTLYVADTVDNTITAIPDATTRSSALHAPLGVISRGGFLNGPLGLTLAPNGDLVAANGNDGNVVEVTPMGRQLAPVTLIPDGAGDLFGLTTTSAGLLFVNDGTNALDIAPAM